MEEYKSIQIQDLSSSQRQQYLLSCNGKYYEVSYAIAELVKVLQDEKTIDGAIAIYIKKMNGKYTSTQVLHIIIQIIQPLQNKVKEEKRNSGAV